MFATIKASIYGGQTQQIQKPEIQKHIYANSQHKV